MLSLGWMAFAHYVGRLIPDQPLWFAVLTTFLFGLPLYLAATYAVTMQRIYHSSQLRTLGILYWLLGRRILAYIWWALWSVTFAFLLLFYLGAADTLEWIAFLIAIPVYAGIHACLAPIAAREYRPYIATHKSLIWTRRITTLVMAVFYVLLVKLTEENYQFASLAEAIRSEGQRIDGTSSSILILETTRLLAFLEGLKSYALDGLFSLNNMLYLACIFVGSIFLFYNIALALSSFMLPISEYRRVLGPIQDTDQPPRLPPQSFAITSAFITFFIFFIYLPATVYFEAWLSSNPAIVKELRKSQTVVIETVEQIGDNYYKPGTTDLIEQAYLDNISELEASINEFRKASDIGFQRITANVEDYLDWYYSLPGEYARITALATGVLEKWMTEKLQTFLMKGDAFGPVQQSIENTLLSNEQLRAEHLKRIDQILTENRVIPTTAQLEIIKHSSLNALKEPPGHSTIVNLENRFLISGGAGAVTGAIAGKVTAKVASKGVIKFGAQALVKVTTGKAASILGGTATGAALGSVFPGIGTTIGAAIGGVIGGVTIGLTVDKLLLMLEESFSRDEFRRHILEAIEDARLEFKRSYGEIEN